MQSIRTAQHQRLSAFICGLKYSFLTSTTCLFGFVERLAFGDVVEHALAESTRLGGAALAKVNVETFAVLACIAAAACTTPSACSIGDTGINRFLAQRRDQCVTGIFALLLQFLDRTRVAYQGHGTT